MTDRELLELAAKAGGIVIEWKNDLAYIGAGSYMPQWWNPLADDGDALRLAVKLHIDLCINNGVAEAIWIDEALSETHATDVPCDEAFEGIEAKYAATRRAIVRAAAVIGESMQ